MSDVFLGQLVTGTPFQEAQAKGMRIAEEERKRKLQNQDSEQPETEDRTHVLFDDPELDLCAWEDDGGSAICSAVQPAHHQ